MPLDANHSPAGAALDENRYFGDGYDRLLSFGTWSTRVSFTRSEAVLGYRFDRWEVRAVGRNLTDRRDPVAESELGDAQYYRLLPRRIEASAGVRF